MRRLRLILKLVDMQRHDTICEIPKWMHRRTKMKQMGTRNW